MSGETRHSRTMSVAMKASRITERNRQMRWGWNWRKAFTGMNSVRIVPTTKSRAVAWTDYVVEFLRRFQNPPVFAILGTSLLVALSIRQKNRRHALSLSLLAFVVAAGPLVADNFKRQRSRFEQGSFFAAQNFARENTKKTAIFLTPPKEAGFRVFSERAIVGEWKDGTQQYFDDDFAREWGRRMEIVMAKDFGKYTDAEIVALAREFGADYIVGQGRRRNLPVAFDGGSTVVYSLPSGP